MADAKIIAKCNGYEQNEIRCTKPFNLSINTQEWFVFLLFFFSNLTLSWLAFISSFQKYLQFNFYFFCHYFCLFSFSFFFSITALRCTFCILFVWTRIIFSTFSSSDFYRNFEYSLANFKFVQNLHTKTLNIRN